jgi:OmpA-OmpF porin, OOP family
MRHVTWAMALAAMVPSACPAAAAAQVEVANARPPVLVFFDWGKPDIGSDAARELDAVAADFRAAPAQRLTVSGHSDRSGSAAGNRRSATRRAAAVAAYLAQRGVPPSAIQLASFGEERPLVPTADGVREPQNRRVEIGFGPAAGQ